MGKPLDPVAIDTIELATVHPALGGLRHPAGIPTAVRDLIPFLSRENRQFQGLDIDVWKGICGVKPWKGDRIADRSPWTGGFEGNSLV